MYISGTEATIRYYDSDKNYIGYGDPMWHSQNRVVTTPENARFMRLVLSAAYGTVYRNNIAINYPETGIGKSRINSNYSSFHFQKNQAATLTE